MVEEARKVDFLGQQMVKKALDRFAQEALKSLLDLYVVTADSFPTTLHGQG